MTPFLEGRRTIEGEYKEIPNLGCLIRRAIAPPSSLPSIVAEFIVWQVLAQMVPIRYTKRHPSLVSTQIKWMYSEEARITGQPSYKEKFWLVIWSAMSFLARLFASILLWP